MKNLYIRYSQPLPATGELVTVVGCLFSLNKDLGFEFYKWRKFILGKLDPLVGPPDSNLINQGPIDFWMPVIHTEKMSLGLKSL